jgi:hypothetical protein
MFENEVPDIIFRAKKNQGREDWVKSYAEEFHNLYFLFAIELLNKKLWDGQNIYHTWDKCIQHFG